jgi:hypothetical protein
MLASLTDDDALEIPNGAAKYVPVAGMSSMRAE